MLPNEGEYLHFTNDDAISPADRNRLQSEIGSKACGLSLIPVMWTPTFFVIKSKVFEEWNSYQEDQQSTLINQIARQVLMHCRSEEKGDWDRGLMMRSSATVETLSERGAYLTKELLADFGTEDISDGILEIYNHFQQSNGAGSIAIIIQARIQLLTRGHASNERRVSATENQWAWEIEANPDLPMKYNSWRAEYDIFSALQVKRVDDKHIKKMLQEASRWCTDLQQGRVHFEWGLEISRLWIFQLDFEDDQHDVGVDPRKLVVVKESPGSTTHNRLSVFKRIDHTTLTGWKKIDNTKVLLVGRDDPYPDLFYITGEEFRAVSSISDVISDIQLFTQGRAVCRTDTCSALISRLDLPRTDTVSATEAVSFMHRTLSLLVSKGALVGEVCFIVHRFIPAKVAVWACAAPGEQLVSIDALWGLPDGLQYLNHDTFQFDIKRGAVSAETIRYKPSYLQENNDGEWALMKISRPLTRHRCLSKNDIEYVALISSKIAIQRNKPTQIMWFCDIEPQMGIGRNVPWFLMDAEIRERKGIATYTSPSLRNYVVATRDHLRFALKLQPSRYLLVLNPEANLFRDEEFIKEVSETAKRQNFPVMLTGSILSHAFYFLEREGVTVVTNSSIRTRIRHRQIFNKLVRDEIPANIVQQGERVVTARIDKSESRSALVVKLLEEAQELLSAREPNEVVGELADLVEVLRSLCSATGVDWAQVLSAAEVKKLKRGSFEHNTVLIETSWPESNTIPLEFGSPLIQLSDLGVITQLGDRYIVPYAAMIAKGGNSTLRLRSDHYISLSMTSAGVEIVEIEKSESTSEEQMSLFK